jgi:hypothetical protein
MLSDTNSVPNFTARVTWNGHNLNAGMRNENLCCYKVTLKYLNLVIQLCTKQLQRPLTTMKLKA